MRKFSQVERLRIYLVGSAVFLLLVIAAFVGTARYVRHLRVKLPASLGVNIVRETDGYTYSQTNQGRTLFTIHAAKAVEHTDGKVAMHDVSVLLYGRNGDRHDRIYGDEFEYDTSAKVVRATGVVHMDLQAAAAAGADTKTLHVTTSGLVYLEKLGVAATGEPIEFETGRFTGHATGADYSSDSGLLMLHSAVSISGMAGQRPMTLTATTADIDNRNQEAVLTDAMYASMGRTMSAKQATLHSRPDGTLARVEAQGDVTAVADGATTVSQRGDFVMNATNQLQSVLLTGGVTYSLDGPLQQRRGKAEQAAIGFDAKGAVNHGVFTGAVHMTERTRATAAEKEPWSQRDLNAAKVEVALAPAGAGRSQVRDMEATGRARLTMVDTGSLKSPGGKGTTDIAADDLKAHMLDAGDGRQTPQLDTVAGVGHTLLHQVGVDGKEQTSAGDTFDAKFRPGAFVKQSGGAKAGSGVTQPADAQAAKLLLSAAQQGHVAVMLRVPAKGATGKENVEHATAQRAVYDGDLDRVTLTGGVELTDADGELWAAQVTLDHQTGDARAEGGVKADLAQDNTALGGAGSGKSGVAAEPMHVLADRAERSHASGIARFYGAPVRLWQQGSQVQAPVIEYARDQKRLVARGVATGAANSPQVHTVGVSGAGDQTGTAAGGGPIAGCPVKTSAGGVGAARVGGKARAPEVMRIASGGLTYSGLSHEADFTGGVWAEGDGGTIRAGEAEVYLQQPAAGQGSAKAGSGGAAAGAAKATTASVGGAADAGSLSGKIERMVASGAVAIDEPGEPGIHATGARLVYTASDQDFLLTGERGAPPKAVDGLGRSTTGAALQFHSCDASGGQRIEALGAVPAGSEGGPAQRVRTESLVDEEKTTVKKKQ